MLWLAGLMGVMAVGAASFVGVPTDDDLAENSEFESYKEDEELLETQRANAPSLIQTSFEADPDDPDEAQSKLISQFVGDMADLNSDATDSGASEAEPEAKLTLEDFMSAESSYFSEQPAEAGSEDAAWEDEEDDEDVIIGWESTGPTAQVFDFNGMEDDLVLVWDDSAGDEPGLAITPDIENPDLMNVQLEGETVAQVPSGVGLSLENIALMPNSTAVMMGWEAA